MLCILCLVIQYLDYCNLSPVQPCLVSSSQCVLFLEFLDVSCLVMATDQSSWFIFMYFLFPCICRNPVSCGNSSLLSVFDFFCMFSWFVSGSQSPPVCVRVSCSLGLY